MSRLEVITLETVFNLKLSQRQSWTRLQPNSGLTNKSNQPRRSARWAPLITTTCNRDVQQLTIHTTLGQVLHESFERSLTKL